MHKALRISLPESLSKALVIFTVALFVQLAVICPSSFVYAEENTGEASTEIYLVASDSGTVPAGSSTTITKSDLPTTSDETPIVPFAVVGACTVVAIVASKKLATSRNSNDQGGGNLS
ncbi:MAG: hypothetical protein Q3982_00680 [Phoenicibacter congonensis]|uniref:Uncharacterized protein n=1 Tax=Phoenicibacter congonensis TaxID=1944646 RepID=A0AA43RG94_9ACTN|nr:hypothetical protein [Phoenicibacter congonensis]